MHTFITFFCKSEKADWIDRAGQIIEAPESRYLRILFKRQKEAEGWKQSYGKICLVVW